MPLRRGYVDGPFGQLHYCEAGSDHRGAQPTLVCLHATAYSSTSLTPIIEALGRKRHVIGLDTPGYGGSDAPDGPVTIPDYADALLAALAELSPSGPADLFGYHTGATIGFTAAARAPQAVGRMVAIGIPLFAPEEHESWRDRLAVRHQLLGDLQQFAERWSFLVENRPEGMSLEAAYANFVDELRAWPDGWWAHDALFEHDLAPLLLRLTQPVLVINPQSTLAEQSRRAASLIPHAALRERSDLAGALFHRHVPEIVAEIEAFLDEAATLERGRTVSESVQ
jgi:pimeloyl-ACP methyl ester carboxylesterase